MFNASLQSSQIVMEKEAGLGNRVKGKEHHLRKRVWENGRSVSWCFKVVWRGIGVEWWMERGEESKNT